MLGRTALLMLATMGLVVSGCLAPDQGARGGDPAPGGTTGTNTTGGTGGTGTVPDPPGGTGGTGTTNQTMPNGTMPNGTMPNGTMPNGTQPNGTLPNGTADATVTVLDNSFSPATVTVPAGGNVMFMNNGQALHSVTIQKADTLEVLIDQDIEPGVSLMVEIPEGGTYQLRCKYHSDGYGAGQVGTIMAS